MGYIKEGWKWTNERVESLGWTDSMACGMCILNTFANMGHGIVFINDKNGGVSEVSVLLGHFNISDHIWFSIACLQ